MLGGLLGVGTLVLWICDLDDESLIKFKGKLQSSAVVWGPQNSPKPYLIMKSKLSLNYEYVRSTNKLSYPNYKKIENFDD